VNGRVNERLIGATRRLAAKADELRFSLPVTHVYNPLTYAWKPHESYLRRFAVAPKRVVFLGMNPGPFGMVQTGVPFGEIAAVRDWLRIQEKVGKPPLEHPRRPVTGFACLRSEVSGQRLWGLFADRFKSPDRFFEAHIVMNYCPLAFIETTGRNRTPDKLAPGERAAVNEICDENLRSILENLQPEWVVGIGDFAAKRAEEVFAGKKLKIGRILHPSPASPAANRNWAQTATAQMRELGIWD